MADPGQIRDINDAARAISDICRNPRQWRERTNAIPKSRTNAHEHAILLRPIRRGTDNSDYSPTRLQRNDKRGSLKPI
jgi:hypothetical protein